MILLQLAFVFGGPRIQMPVCILMIIYVIYSYLIESHHKNLMMDIDILNNQLNNKDGQFY